MTGFFQALASKLAERWAALLLLPGALFAAAALVGVQLGHTDAVNRQQLSHIVAKTADHLARQAPGTQGLLVITVLLAATGTGLVVQALAGTTRAIWLGQWPRPTAWLCRWRIGRRRTRWHRRVQRRHELQSAHPRDTRTPAQQHDINAAAERTNRIALAEPGRPTWMGDRIHAVEHIAWNRHGLDLTFAWPRLWLVAPDTTRTEITTAHAAFAAAVATGTWAWPYLILALLWWPAALIGICIGATGWVRARSAITDLTTLSESALDLHARTLAIELGVAEQDTTGPLTVDEGEQLTARVRKGR